MRGWVAIAALMALPLGACETTVGATLYPANDQAQQIGMLHGSFVTVGSGHGPLTLVMPDGEVLNGTYSTIPGGSSSFGSLYASVYGTGGYASGSGFGSAFSIPNASQGMADAGGPRTTLHCEYVVSNLSGHGTGACRTTQGALFRLQY